MSAATPSPLAWYGAAVTSTIQGVFGKAGGDRTAVYSYNANEIIAAAIAPGERGAFWNILRRIG